MKILIVSAANPLRAYSGLKYLTKALKSNGMDVELRAKIPKEMIWETNEWEINVKSFYDSWYGSIPLLRRYLVHLHMLILGIFISDIIIFHELTFFRHVVFLKRIFPKKRFIHYCTELYTEEDVPQDKRLLKFYKKHANIPDLIIECDKGREKLRREMYGINKPTVVIPNTIPKSEIPKKGLEGSLAKMAELPKIPTGVPVLVYTGGAYLHRQLDMIIDAISNIDKKIFFLAFCYGEREAIINLENVCERKLGSKYYKICDSVPRDELLKCINEATAGVVYYKPSLSIGNLYASPTKLFEYIGAGVPVISSNNPEIVSLIEKNNLGICVKDESVEALTNAINEIVFNKEKILQIKKSQETAFNNSLCYEVAAKEAIETIMEIVYQKEAEK